MAVTYVSGSAASLQQEPAVTTIVLTLGAAVAVDDVIVGMAGWDGTGDNISTVTDSLGNSYTLNADKIDDTTGNQSGRTFRSKVTVAGTPTITVTFTTARASRRVIAAAWSGSAAAPFDTSVGNWQTSPGTGTDAVTSTAVTTAENNELCVGFHQNTGEVDPGTGTITAGTNYTSRLVDDAILMVEDRVLAAAGSVAATFTISNNHRSISHIVAIKELGGLILFCNNPVQAGSSAGLLTLTQPTASTSTTGWIVGTTVANRYSRQTYNTEIPAANFTTTAQPSGAPTNSAEDCWRISAVTTGDFSAGTWYSSLSVIAVTSGGFHDGRARFRVFRSANADGTSATEVTQGTMVGSLTTNLTTGVAQSSSASTQIGTLTLTNEYLFLQTAWETL